MGLVPAMTVKCTVALVKSMRAGEGVSYGHTWIAQHDTTLALMPIGYADGVFRALGGRLEVLINGRRRPGVGRICMDQFLVDLGPGQVDVAEGDEAILFGPGSTGEPTAQDWADLLGTIHYEVVTSPRGRIVDLPGPIARPETVERRTNAADATRRQGLARGRRRADRGRAPSSGPRLADRWWRGPIACEDPYAPTRISSGSTTDRSYVVTTPDGVPAGGARGRPGRRPTDRGLRPWVLSSHGRLPLSAQAAGRAMGAERPDGLLRPARTRPVRRSRPRRPTR